MNDIERTSYKQDMETLVRVTSEALQRFPRNEIGLTPDSVKCLPEYVAAKQAYAAAFEQLRRVNGYIMKIKVKRRA